MLFLFMFLVDGFQSLHIIQNFTLNIIFSFNAITQSFDSKKKHKTLRRSKILFILFWGKRTTPPHSVFATDNIVKLCQKKYTFASNSVFRFFFATCKVARPKNLRIEISEVCTCTRLQTYRD